MNNQPNKRSNRVQAFLRFYRPHWRLFALDMVCALMIALVDLAFPMVTRYALNTYLPGKLYNAFFLLIGAITLGYMLRAVMSYIVSYFGHFMGVLMEADMRRDIFTQLQRLSFRFYDHNRTGRLMSRVTTDLFEITELAHHGPEDLFISMVTIVGALIYLFRLEWRLALPMFLMVPLIVGFSLMLRARMRKASAQVKEKMAGINADLESSISGAKTAKAFSNEQYEIDKFEQGNQRFMGAKGGFYSAMGLFHGGTEFLMGMMGVVVLLVGGILLMRGRMGVTELITFNLFVGTITAPIKKLTSFMEQYVVGMAGFNRYMEIMDESPDITDAPDAIDLPQIQGDIALTHVSFSYNDGGDSVLNDVNLTIPQGKTLALVGPSGGGKTTLCQLIPRFYDVQAGAVTIDGIDVRKIKLASLRGHIGIVQQDVFLFAGSVLDNIRYGRVNATMEEVIEAAKRAEIHDDIMNMPDGYNTMVGERGTLLSGGQKQRVSIARIFLKDPRILILDEATSALDTATEVKIQQAFERLSIGRTTIVIAHRLSTIQNADEIAVIGDQGVLEKGTHDALIAKKGVYASLTHAQRLTHSKESQQVPSSFREDATSI